LYISKENLDVILALPRKTLISDLESILHDLKARYDFYKTLVETDGWYEDTMSFPIHAIYLLGELRAEESLGTILELFRQGDDFLDFWFSEFLTGNFWEPLYHIAQNLTERLKHYLCEPGLSTYVRTEIATVSTQIALHQPERKAEVINWFKYIFQFYIDSDLKDNVIDSDAIGLMICELGDLNAGQLIPEIEKLFELGYVGQVICGDLPEVREDIAKPPKNDPTKEIMDIYDRYHRITTTWAGYNETEDEEIPHDEMVYPHKDIYPFEDETPFTDYEEIPETVPLRTGPKIGRNDPCPCGSGKKYKKCCLNKN
ncbi:MAG: hypothetical protein DRJ05_07420, partial [Bacteroidetes bacterium]